MQVPWIFFFRRRACSRWGESAIRERESETAEYTFLGWTRHQMEWKKALHQKWSEAARIFLANVPSQESLLASGMAPARAPRLGETGRPFSPLPRICQPELAGAMPKVPKGRRFAGLACWGFFIILFSSKIRVGVHTSSNVENIPLSRPSRQHKVTRLFAR